MSGHHAGHTPRNTPAADHRLDQFAAAVAEARATNPALAALATTEGQFIDAAMDIGAHLDRPTVGAAWLILGQLFSTNLASVPPEQQAAQLAVLLNVAKLAGARLYVGDRLPVTLPCPFAYGDGTPCKTSRTGTTPEQAETLMRAHVWQNHPGETWPTKPPIEDQKVGTLPTMEEIGLPPMASERVEPRVQQYPVGRPLPTSDEDPYPLSVLGEKPSFGQLKRFANLRVLAMTYLGVDRQHGDPITGRKGDLTPQAAWEEAERYYDAVLGATAAAREADTDSDVQAATPGEYDLTVDEALEAMHTGRVPPGARSQPKHAPHEVCDCRPGETYHCAADDTDSEAQ